jgi:hypothetical protein
MTQPVEIPIGGYPFLGTPLDEADFRGGAAIYAIICITEGGKWTVIDIGQSEEMGSRMDLPDRKDCWKHKCSSMNIWVCEYRMSATVYTKEDRLRVERNLRRELKPTCGEPESAKRTRKGIA